LAAIEARASARLGVAALDLGTGAWFSHRADERFAMCSTHKALSAAAILARVDRGRDSLARRLRIDARDLLPYSPVTRLHVGGSMSLADICEAAITMSDNTAANLMLASLGGPAGLTAWLRQLGDALTRLDRTEPFLNEAARGDPRDTTTPRAMAADLRRLALGDALAPDSRQRLLTWLFACKTGDRRLRAGVPAGWRVADKTGTGKNGAAGDVGVLWPPGSPPIIVAAYIADTTAAPAEQDAALAGAARALVQAVAG
jgi:beta-lactamase class A